MPLSLRDDLGTDIDDIFAYTVVKSVRIRDHRLGCMHLFALLGALAYIGIYTLANKLAYLEFHTPSGTVRFKLQQPTVDSCDPESPTCDDAFPETSDLPYCCQDNCTSVPDDPGGCQCSYRPHFRNYMCEYTDGDSASVLSSGDIFVVTKTRVQNEVVNGACLAKYAQSCSKLWTIESQSSSFVPGIESFTLLADHAAQVQSLDWWQQARDLTGFLFVPKAGPAQDALCASRTSYADPVPNDWGALAHEAPCYIEPDHPPNSNLDIFKLQDLLVASGIGGQGLDQESFAGSGHSVRYEGMTIMMNIHYVNTRPWRGVVSNSGYYFYELSGLSKNAYGQHTVIPEAGAFTSQSKRTVKAFHGILISATVTGNIGVFSFNNLLIQLAAASALLSVSVVVANLTATSCLCKHRKYYHHTMVEQTPDFSDVDRLESKTMDELRQICSSRNLPLGGSRETLVFRILLDEAEEGPGNADAEAAGASFHSSSSQASPSQAQSRPRTAAQAAASSGTGSGNREQPMLVQGRELMNQRLLD
eukprot:CAMPEP_0206438488 /NCGR_PEP_ID=MMETSP0324_2-20121206/11658_1 /ASSEMBLY_ACC=CAM_ASM_000836 /TAXON_ID=2866 /ORGANISM="Crypthecodinium cohnii, Strain Seligo" /LENGTH=531 /DNA_ID=CAMNT_0053905953 /DNA_START=151 /DNA_END=1747 /DNA_ORIENTATION=-